MSKRTLETLVWVLIYGGLLTLAVGVFVLRAEEGRLGWVLALGGASAAVAGAVGMVVRARMPDRN